MKYIFYHPNTNEQKSKYPLIVFLHGVGERGNNPEVVKRNGLPKTIEEGLELPVYVLAPQCPDNDRWHASVLNRLIEEFVAAHPIDKNRIYLTGLSMGGFGTWKLAMQHPNKFAALAPICGGGSVYELYKIKHIPIWVFHGAKDKVIPIEKSTIMVDELKKMGANVKYTIYPDAEHDSWTETYKNPELYEWMLAQKKK